MEEKLSIIEWVNLSNKVSTLEKKNEDLGKVILLMAEYIINSGAPNWEVENVIRHFTNKVNEKNMEGK